MSMSFRFFTRSILAISALAAAAGLGAVFAQQMPASKVTPVMKQGLADIPGREVQMITIDIPPGGGSAPHRHPGHHIFGYVLEGSYRFKAGDEPEKVLNKGDTFYEPSGVLHAVSRNASDSVPAKVLAVIVAESGKPTTVPEK
jgi:quercetin dioxygenase-like cupin family protein